MYEARFTVQSRKLHLIDLQFDHSERVVKAVPT